MKVTQKTVKRIFTIAFLLVSAVFFTTIVSCHNVVLQELLRNRRYDAVSKNADLKHVEITWFYQGGLRTMTQAVSTADKNGNYLIPITSEEADKVTSVLVRAITAVQGEQKPVVVYTPDTAYIPTFPSYDDVDNWPQEVGVSVTAIDGKTQKNYRVIFQRS